MTDSQIETIVFQVQGSSPEPYRVTFERKNLGVRAFCTCPAGQNGTSCKHRTLLLQGVVDDIVGGKIEDLGVLAGWVRGTRLGLAVEQLDDAELLLQQAKLRLANAKHALASAMYGNERERK
jgi:uncharacterized Zn finger protein